MQMKNKSTLASKIFSVIISLILLFSGIKAQTPRMTIEQTLSDEAQKSTIAFSGLAFITGDFCSATFLPPGKVSDYFGFQYLRDNDITAMGHNTDFLTRVANNMLYVLNENQKNQIITEARSQVNQISKYAEQRLPLIKAFYRLLVKDFPFGSTKLDKRAVADYSAQIYWLDGKISIERAKLFGSILRNLNGRQRGYLDSLKNFGVRNWPELPDQINKQLLTNSEFVAVMTYASEMFAWYAGNEASDVYFCPERQGNYFGSFYMKDAPAMGNPDYSIDTNLTRNGGNTFLSFLNSTQRLMITCLVDTQRAALNKIVDVRTHISRLLRGYLKHDLIDTSMVLSLSLKYGELDGEISYNYATNFSKVDWLLTSNQYNSLVQLRNLDKYPCSGAFLYSDRISSPDIVNTDFFFNKANNQENKNPGLSNFQMNNYPNPFLNQTTITYQISEANNVKIKITDIYGRELITLVDHYQRPGSYSVVLSSVNLPVEGRVFYYHISVGSSWDTKMMIRDK